MKPDIIIGPSDINVGKDAPKFGNKRKDKMDERTAAWMRGMQEALSNQNAADGALKPSLWAPILPIEEELQRSNLEHLRDSGPETYGGLVLYDEDSVLATPSSFKHLPRMSITSLETPHAILRAVDLGVDMLAIPFITTATEAGIALTLKFPVPSAAAVASDPTANDGKLPLGFSLWPPSHSASLEPLVHGCSCYACTTHHRAYIRHLLNAKEMLAWVLLQIHNHHTMDKFFEGVRSSIAGGTFGADSKSFSARFTDQMPENGGEGPRVRGYQLGPKEHGAPKGSKPPRRKLDKTKLEAIQAKKAEKAQQKIDDEAQKLAEAVEADLGDGSILGTTFLEN